MELIAAVVSGIAFVLAIAVVFQARSLARPPKGPVVSLTPLVNDILENLAFPAVPAPAELPEPERSPQSIAARQQLRDFMAAFDSWCSWVQRNFPKASLILNQNRVYTDALKGLYEHFGQAESGRGQNALTQKLGKAFKDVAAFVVKTSDQDLDRQRTNDLVQTSIDRLLNSAGFILYTPSDRDPYTLPGSEVTIRVKEVRVRGLKDRDGAIVAHPEVVERH